MAFQCTHLGELHEKAFRRLGGCVRVVVLDNLREGVLVPDIYDPTLNPLYRVELIRNPVLMVFPEETMVDCGHRAIGSISKNEYALPAGTRSEIQPTGNERQRSSADRAAVENLRILFSNVFNAAVNAGVGSRGVGLA